MTTQSPALLPEDHPTEREEKERRPVFIVLGIVGVLLCLGLICAGAAFIPRLAVPPATEAPAIAETKAGAPAQTPTPTEPALPYTCQWLPFWSVPGADSPAILLIHDPAGEPLSYGDYPEDGAFTGDGVSLTPVEDGLVSVRGDEGAGPGDAFSVGYRSETLGVDCEFSGALSWDTFTASKIQVWDAPGDVRDYDMVALYEQAEDTDDLIEVWMWVNGFPFFPRAEGRAAAPVYDPGPPGSLTTRLPARSDLEPPAGGGPLIQAIDNPAIPIPDPLAQHPTVDEPWPVADGTALPRGWITAYGPEVAVTPGDNTLLTVIPEHTVSTSEVYGAQVFWAWEWKSDPYTVNSPNARAEVRGAWSGLVYNPASQQSIFWLERGTAQIAGLAGGVEGEPVAVEGPADGAHLALVVIGTDGVVQPPQTIEVTQLGDHAGIYLNALDGAVTIVIELAAPFTAENFQVNRANLSWEILFDVDGRFETGATRDFAQYRELGIEVQYLSRGPSRTYCNVLRTADDYRTCSRDPFTVSVGPDGRVYITARWDELVRLLDSAGSPIDPASLLWRFAHAHYGGTLDTKDVFPEQVR